MTIVLAVNLLDGQPPVNGQVVRNVGEIRVKGDSVIMGEPLDFTKDNVDEYVFRRGRRRFRDFRLSSKLLIVYVALTVLPISLLSVISYRQYEKSIVQQIGEYMPKFLDQANGSIDQHIGKLAVLPEQLFSSTDVVRILRKDSYQSNSDLNTDTYVMNNYLSKTFLEGSNSEILGVFILSKTGCSPLPASILRGWTARAC
ncbi:hypothetical protein HMSSN036_66090 [Paenibacillus macerans]|nr:hypothetical protein HMSSN036_66090 [Paenibacillus macerans]